MLGGCEVSRTCISHIDRDSNGRCDNCGTKMEVTRSDVLSIEIVTAPSKTYYALGESLDLTGGLLRVHFRDGMTTDIALDADGVSVDAPDMGIMGKKSVLVRYGGQRAVFEIEVGEQRFTVTFDMDGAGEIPSQTVTINGHVSEPTPPERAGYDFVGWYADEGFETEFDFALTPIMRDTTIYARWVKKYTIHYSENYAGGAESVAETENGRIRDMAPPSRQGYIFTGWFYDAACEHEVDFDAVVEEETTVYAGWTEESVGTVTVTFDYNYDGAEDETTQVAKGGMVKKPRTPKRPNVTTAGHQAQDFKFDGWYTSGDFKEEFNFSRMTVEEDLTLYAKWTGTYIFEAEHTALVDEEGLPLKGVGASGGAEGTSMIQSMPRGAEGMMASGGFFVTFLYRKGLALNFDIVSDREVSDVTLILRITCENKEFCLDPYLDTGKTESGTQISKYTVTVNGEEVAYDQIEIPASDVAGHADTGGRRPFSDHVLAVNLTLHKGSNRITLLTDNDHGMGGTMSATAPVVDCIKLTTSATLSWDPKLGNLDGKN